MYKRIFLFFLLIFASFQVNAQCLDIKDKVVFIYGNHVVTESDLRALGYIFNLKANEDRKHILKMAEEIEKRYYCLKENYPFESDFKREFPFLYYQLNLFYEGRFLPDERLKGYCIDYSLVKENLFKLLFVLKYSFLIENEEEECMKLPVYFEN